MHRTRRPRKPPGSIGCFTTFRPRRRAFQGIAPEKLPAGTLQGQNDWKRTGYGGPCPPVGQHRYFHKLYALDTVLPDLGQPDKRRIEQAMQGHVLAEAQLVGLYQRRR